MTTPSSAAINTSLPPASASTCSTPTWVWTPQSRALAGPLRASCLESGSTGAPLPVLGLRGIWRLPHDFYFTAQAQYFYIDYNEYNGSLSDLKATVVWQATPRFGVGLGYNDFRFRFDLDKRLFDGRLRWNYGGAMAFASLAF